MYNAIITKKEKTNQGLRITVNFTDGENIIEEAVIPQSEEGFNYWVKSRLIDLNSIISLEQGYDVNTTITATEAEPSLTQAEKDEIQWFKDYRSWVNIKINLVDTGVVPITNAKVQALLTKVKTNLKPEYIDKL